MSHGSSIPLASSRDSKAHIFNCAFFHFSVNTRVAKKNPDTVGLLIHSRQYLNK